MLIYWCSRLSPNDTRFEKKKREQELQAAKHLDLGSDNEGGSESDSETEDEDAEMLTPALDLQVLQAVSSMLRHSRSRQGSCVLACLCTLGVTFDIGVPWRLSPAHKFHMWLVLCRT